MSATVISAENISKCYPLIHERKSHGGYRTLRDDIVQLFKKPGQWLSRRSGPELEQFWALNDISFRIDAGEVVGIIGRNGAGKSTLLKILSRITKPTAGRCVLHGRVGSLLEVGTGFHPELTGRENIFMNGSILGMSRQEINRNFDAIVEFAEVEKFLDTPVKRYSSGMYVRLAFAVAAHLEPEILIVDEVLAVGDAEFQKKCFGKMQDVAEHGRTVLFVSHSMPMIQRLCKRAIVLESGKIVADADASTAVHHYLSNGVTHPAEREWPNPAQAPGDDCAKLKSVRLLNKANEVSACMEIHEEFSVEVEYWKYDDHTPTTVTVHFINDSGIILFATADFTSTSWKERAHAPGLIKTRCRIPANFFAEGSFSVLAAIVSYNPNLVHAREPDAVHFQVVDHTTNEGVRGVYTGSKWPGVMRPFLEWDVQSV